VIYHTGYYRVINYRILQSDKLHTVLQSDKLYRVINYTEYYRVINYTEYYRIEYNILTTLKHTH